jgi:hypothetical protein
MKTAHWLIFTLLLWLSPTQVPAAHGLSPPLHQHSLSAASLYEKADSRVVEQDAPSCGRYTKTRTVSPHLQGLAGELYARISPQDYAPSAALSARLISPSFIIPGFLTNGFSASPRSPPFFSTLTADTGC